MALSEFRRRVVGAAALEPGTYEQVERDEGATTQALAIVLLSGFGTALGALGSLRPATLVAGILVAVLGWGVWAGLCLLIGGRLLPAEETRPEAGEILRVLGFAAVPGIAQALGYVAPLRTPVLAMTELWMILAMAVAVRQALAYRSPYRALAVCVAGWTARALVVVVLLAVVRPALGRRVGETRRPSDAVPTAGYLGVVKPSGVAPPVE